MSQTIDNTRIDAERAARVHTLVIEAKDLLDAVAESLADGHVTLGEIATVATHLFETGAALIAVVGAPKRNASPAELFRRLGQLLRPKHRHPTGG